MVEEKAAEDDAPGEVQALVRLKAFAFQAFHFLSVVNQRAQRANRRANFQRVLNHLDSALDAKTKPEFVSK